jgi:hypothetical protein
MNGPVSNHPVLSRGSILDAIATCRKELGVVQQRLGTPLEQPQDVDHASEIVHKINNLTAALALFEG